MEPKAPAPATNAEVERMLNRLRRIEGQVRGLQRMIEEGKDCESVLTQLSAVKSALDRVGIHLISHRMKDCLAAGMDVEVDEAAMEQAFEIFLKYTSGWRLATPSAAVGSSEPAP